VFQLSPTMSMMVGGVLQFDNRDASTGPNGATDSSFGTTWGSLGARPVFMLSKYTGVAVEGGVDIVKAQGTNAPTEVLGKVTVAGLLRPAADFWARPELRVFVTTAAWNQGVNDTGGTGGAAFAGDKAGVTFGVQGEAWW
jgi:maltoporin